MMWVIKLDGDLNNDPILPVWLELMVQLGGGRVTLVCDGGSFTNEIKHSQAHWNFDNLAAHHMMLLAMAQTAYLAHGLQPKLQLANNDISIRQVLRAGHTALWLPLDLLREQTSPYAMQDTSDSIALDLACKLNAEHFVLVKSCMINPTASVAELSQSGVLDRRFALIASNTGLPIDIMHCNELERMRNLLLGEIKNTG
jgi:5-(aminomethyl)-3-furanmethanol phosphate kinase